MNPAVGIAKTKNLSQETYWRQIGDKIGLHLGRVKSFIYKDSAKWRHGYVSVFFILHPRNFSCMQYFSVSHKPNITCRQGENCNCFSFSSNKFNFVSAAVSVALDHSTYIAFC